MSDDRSNAKDAKESSALICFAKLDGKQDEFMSQRKHYRRADVVS